MSLIAESTLLAAVPDSLYIGGEWVAAASGTTTRELVGLQPSGPGLVEDLDAGHYVPARAA